MSEIDFDKRLEELYNNFRRQLPERQKTIASAWQGFMDERQTTHLEELRFHVHKLAGAASTYGFTDIGDQAREVETRLDNYLRLGDTTGIEDELQPRLDRIATLIQAAAEA